MTSSTTRAVASYIVAMLAILAALIAAGIGGVAAVDVLRGYASGGTHYAHGHLGAVEALRRFAVSGDEADFAHYHRSIRVPISNGRAREILEQPDLDIADSYPFLIDGKNHPDDVPGIARLFRFVRGTAMFEPALAAWRQADAEIRTLDGLAERLYGARRDRPADIVSRDAILNEIGRVDARLIELEEQFAHGLGAVARTISRWLYAGLSGFGLLLACLVTVLGYRAGRRLTEAERAIRDREQRFRDVAETAAGWIWETDAELRFTYLSDRVEQAAGVTKSEFLGRSRAGTAVFEDTPDWQRHVDDLKHRRPFQGFEYAYRHPDGGMRYFRINGRPFFAADGSFLGYRGTGTDTTIEVTARREIEARIELQDAVLEAVGQGISVVDANLTVVAFNRRVVELLDLPPGKLRVGDCLETFLRYEAERGEHGAVDVDSHVAAALAQAARFEPQVTERVRPNGMVLEIRSQPLSTGGFVTTYTDISALRNAALDLQRAKIAAETANHAKSAFLANMSHELRTPLNAVIGFSDLMEKERFGPLGERYSGYARDIRQSGQHLLAVINDILDLARVEAGKVDIAVEPQEPRQVVEDCLRMLRHRAAEAGVDLRNEVPEAAPPLHADLQRLRQIVLNLVGNAIKFSGTGTEVAVRLTRTSHADGLQVVDQGIGMSPDKIEAAFQPFTQIHGGFDRKFDGSGLGLPLVRSYMDLHGGSVGIESRVGAGTTVTVLFQRPAGRSPDPPTASVSEPTRL